MGEGGPAGPDEGQAPAAARPPGNHPRSLPLPPTPAEGSRPLPTDRTIDACLRKPPGRACPAPTARRPGNGCPRKPHSVSISPSVGRGAPTSPRPPAAAHSRANRRGRRPRRPAEACAAANNSPCLPPWGKVAPQGRMRGRLPPPPIPGQPVGGGVPDAPETSRQHPSPGQSPANIRPRKPAGRACPAPTG